MRMLVITPARSQLQRMVRSFASVTENILITSDRRNNKRREIQITMSRTSQSPENV